VLRDLIGHLEGAATHLRGLERLMVDVEHAPSAPPPDALGVGMNGGIGNGHVPVTVQERERIHNARTLIDGLRNGNGHPPQATSAPTPAALPAPPPGKATAQEREEYYALLERFTAWCAERGQPFQAGMRAAIAVAMGEPQTFAPKQGGGKRQRKRDLAADAAAAGDRRRQWTPERKAKHLQAMRAAAARRAARNGEAAP
jgi:hypothetical protein